MALQAIQAVGPAYTDGMSKPFFSIYADWDAEAGVWVATSDDVPGLVTESATLESLAVKLKDLVPELLDANGVVVEGQITYELLARRFDVVSHTMH